MRSSIALVKGEKPAKNIVCPRCGHTFPITTSRSKKAHKCKNFLPIDSNAKKRCIKGHPIALSAEVCRYGHPPQQRHRRQIRNNAKRTKCGYRGCGG